MDGLKFACFRKWNEQHSERHSSLCYSLSTVNPVIWSEKPINLCSSDCCAARAGKKGSHKLAKQHGFERGRNYLSAESNSVIASSQRNRRESNF